MEQQSLAVMSCTAEIEVLRRALIDHEAVVLMKVYGRFDKVRQLLIEQGLLEHAVLMANASMENEIFYPDLSQVEEGEALPYFSTIVVNRSWKHH
jgi:precorrin-2/cobalt-factor-2 C20-methyltransferase